MVRKFLKMALGYGVVGTLSAAFSFLLLPVYTRLLPPAEYGVIDVVLTLVNLLVALAVLGVDQALNAFFFDGDEVYHSRLGGTALFTVLALGFGLWLAVVAVAPFISQALFGNSSYNHLIYLVSINVLVLPMLTVLLAIYRLRLQVLRVNFIGLLSLAVNLVAVTIFVLVLRLGVFGIALATFITQSLVALVVLVTLRRELRLPFDRSLLGPLSIAGAGLLPATISWLLLVNVDRLILTQFVSASELGLYSLANKLAMLLSIVFTMCWSAWLPMALAMADEDGADRQYAQMLELFAVGSMLIALVMGVFAPELLTVISREEYHAAAPYVLALMVFTGPLTFVSACFNVAFYARKRTHLVSVINISGACLNIVLNLVLNPLLGVWGAVLATLVAGACSLAIAFLLSRRLMPIAYRWANLLPVAVVYALLVAAFVAAPATAVVWKVTACAAFVAAAILCDLVPRQLLKQTFSQLFGRLLAWRSL